jgi:hypothetical protein
MNRANSAVAAILRSPFHFLASPGLLLLDITGRKGGRRYQIPVGYHDQGDALCVLVSDAVNRTWWRNFREPGALRVCLRGRWLPARAEVLAPDCPEFRRRAQASFRRAAFMPRIFGIDFDRERGLTPEQVEELAAYAVVVPVEVEQGG